MAALRVLELRIHGIANAPPADMLCTINERVERADGDEQGSFWRIKSKGRVRRLPWSTRVEIEAYSWGNQARTGGAALAPIGRAIVHVFWLFVLPFGLCNLAYWARRDIKGEAEDRKWWAGGDGAIAIRIFAMLQTLFYVVGFTTVFVHLIGLQCFRAVADGAARTCAALPAWLDFLVGWSPAARAALWSIAPVAIILLIYVVSRRPRRLFNPDRSFDDEAAPKPRRSSRRRRGAEDVAPPRPPLLASPAFWQRSRVAQTSERAHLAGSIALVVLLLAGDAMLDAQPAGTPFVVLIATGAVFAVTPFATAMTAAAAIALLAALAVVVVAGLSEKHVSIRALRGWASVVLMSTIGLYLVWLSTALLLRRDAADAVGLGRDLGLRGLLVAPTVIAALCALIAVASLAWGLGWRRPVVRTLLTLAFVAVAASELGARSIEAQSPWPRFWLSVITVLAVALAVVIAYAPSKQPEVRAASRFAAWHGNGAAVTLLISLLSSLVMTTLLVVGTHAWLTAGRGEAEVSGPWRVLEPQRAQTVCGAVADASLDASAAECLIAAPAFYERFSVMVVVMMVVIAVVVGLAVLSAGARPVPAFSIPALRFPASTPADRRAADRSLGGTARLTTDPRAEVHPGPAYPDAPHVALTSHYPPPESNPAGRRRTVAHARRTAALLHRGEPVLRWVAILTALALVPLAVPFWGELLSRDNPANAVVRAAGWGGQDAADAWATAVNASLWALGLLALAAVAWVVTNAVTAAERPLGLIWDIICFFPMAGHPFGPPCYGERVVPELRKRVRAWLADEGEGARVILSAHSMGAVIAVATVFAIHGADQRAGASAGQRGVQRVALLTFGAQLRAYFSRFFPQVFGADVLGIRGTTGPTLLGADPWRQQVLEDFSASAVRDVVGSADTLVELLGGDPGDRRGAVPRWRSLWRRTDPLGFPVDGYWNDTVEGVGSAIDRGASERSPTSYLWAVAGHGDYLSTLQYREARDELVAMLRERRA